jgi:DNA-binding response OmpR family regulator
MSAPTESSPVRIALIDDDSGLLTVLTRRFEALQWQSQVLPYPPASEHLAVMRLHALLVNPVLSGMDYLERVAEALPSMALLVLSPQVTVAHRVRGLRAGADDWITKPCHPEELVARIQAVLRRRRLGDMPDEDRVSQAGELVIRPDRFDAYAGDQPAGLSRREYELLRQLALAEGRVLERERVYERVWGYTMVRGDRSVDVFVRKLRAKLERISPEWRYVHTHFGIGYRFAAEPVEGSPAALSAAAARQAQAREPAATVQGPSRSEAQDRPPETELQDRPETDVPFDLQLIN